MADAFLSVGTPVQVALPYLLQHAAAVREAIHLRVRHNLGAARRLAGAYPSCELLHVEGGWSAVIRVPAIRSEEQLVLDLLDRERVLVHPGFFFDFPREAYVVVSLLCSETVFAEGLEKLLRHSACFSS